jgi:hypothetical protein
MLNLFIGVIVTSMEEALSDFEADVEEAKKLQVRPMYSYLLCGFSHHRPRN